MANNNKFALDLNKYLSGASKQGTKEVRGVALAGLKGVMRKTPVDEGTARGNWNTGINTINETIQTDFTKKPARGQFDRASYNRGSAEIASYKTGDTINISNSLPYIKRLEYDDSFSAQGSGMVRRTIGELIAFLKKKKKKV